MKWTKQTSVILFVLTLLVMLSGCSFERQANRSLKRESSSSRRQEETIPEVDTESELVDFVQTMQKSQRIEIYDATKDECLVKLDDSESINKLFESFVTEDWIFQDSIPSDVKAKYECRFYQDSTKTILGKDNGKEINPVTLTFYENAPYVTIDINIIIGKMDLNFQTQEDFCPTIETLINN